MNFQNKSFVGTTQYHIIINSERIFIFVDAINYENTFTAKFSRFTVCG